MVQPRRTPVWLRSFPRKRGQLGEFLRHAPPAKRVSRKPIRLRHAGDPAGARAWLCVGGEKERTSILPLFPVGIADEVDLVRIAVGAGDRELAETGAVAATRRAALNPDVQTMAATAAQTRGLLTDDVHELRRAVSLFERCPRPLVLASALEDLGTAILTGGVSDEGIRALTRGLTVYTLAGAPWDAGRVRGQLRNHGVRRRLTPAERPQDGWAAMTDSELGVARLVAQGLTNREVAERLNVSPHTVSSHLRRVFAKLDINSRVALTRLAGDHDARA